MNIAADMVSAACMKQVEQVVLCSNDSDMEGALKAIRTHCPGIRLGLIAPSASPGRHVSKDLSKHVDWVKDLKPADLAAAQLPDKIPGTSIKKPEGW